MTKSQTPALSGRDNYLTKKTPFCKIFGSDRRLILQTDRRVGHRQLSSVVFEKESDIPKNVSNVSKESDVPKNASGVPKNASGVPKKESDVPVPYSAPVPTIGYIGGREILWGMGWEPDPQDLKNEVGNPATPLSRYHQTALVMPTLQEVDRALNGIREEKRKLVIINMLFIITCACLAPDSVAPICTMGHHPCGSGNCGNVSEGVREFRMGRVDQICCQCSTT